MKHKIKVSDASLSTFPFYVYVTLLETPGPVFKDDMVEAVFTHDLKIAITRHYPYQTPIVRWQSPIFHPNIMSPDDGGFVCTKLVKKWSFSSDLYMFLKGLELLLAHPNPDDPYENNSCTMAAEYFNTNQFVPPELTVQRKKPRIIQREE